jgi:iron complex outermembrane recepter protein
MLRRFMALLTTCSVAAVAAPAFAQAQSSAVQDGSASGEQPQDDSAEIVVTAQKREERLIDVPVSVSVVSPAQLDRQNIQSVSELSRAVPSLTGSDPKQLSIRGVQTNGVNRTSESAATVVLDGVVLGRAATSGLFDVARVEVLSGPQGMLFGKNASAGVVNIVTASPDPSKRELIFHADAGTFNFHRERITANVPLAETAALRFSAYNSTQDTPVRTTLRGGDRNYVYENGLRGRLLWDATPSLTFNLIADYERNGGSGTAGAVFALVDPTTPLATTLAACGVTPSLRNNLNCSDSQSKAAQRSERYGVSGQVDLSLGGYTLTSITANRWYNLGDFAYTGPAPDSDLLPTDILNTNLSATRYETFSQELRIASPSGETLEFVAGMFYSDTDSRDRVTQAGGLGRLGGTPTFLVANLLTSGTLAGPFGATTRFGRQTTINFEQRSLAAFGQATINVTDQLSLIAGARYTDEKLDIAIVSPDRAGIAALGFGYFAPFSNAFPNLTRTVNTDNFSWRLGARYEFSPALSAYATASRGYKGPAVNDQAVLAAGISPVIEPEIPMYYEAGVKGSFANGRLLGTLALFHNKVKNFQTAIYVPPSGTVAAGVFAQGNAPYITAKGVEFALMGRPTPELSLNFGVLYNDTSYSPDFVVPCNSQQTAGAGSCSALGTTAPTEHLANSPVWRMVLGGEYARNFSGDLTGFVQSDFVYESGYSFSATPDANLRRGESHQLGARIGVRDEQSGWGISIFGRNLLNDFDPAVGADPIGAFNGGSGRSYTVVPSLTNYRTFGATIDLKF